MTHGTTGLGEYAIHSTATGNVAAFESNGTTYYKMIAAPISLAQPNNTAADAVNAEFWRLERPVRAAHGVANGGEGAAATGRPGLLNAAPMLFSVPYM